MLYNYYINGKLINNFIIDFSYSDNLNDIATTFNFSSYENFGIKSENNGKQSINKLEVIAENEDKPFYVGYVTDVEHTTDRKVFKYSGFDVGFYLNKNQIIKQFKGDKNIGQELQELCNENNISITKPNEKDPNTIDILSFTKRVKKIYKGETLGNILKEILQLEKNKGGLKDVYIDCKNGNLSIKKYKEEESLIVPISQAILIDGLTTYNNISVKYSIQNLRNQILVTDNANDKISKQIPEKDDESIATYGLLTHVEKVDTNKENNLKSLAINKLQELNKIEETINLSIIGDYNAAAGTVIPVNIEEYGLNDLFLITTANHNIKQNLESVDITLKKYL